MVSAFKVYLISWKLGWDAKWPLGGIEWLLLVAPIRFRFSLSTQPESWTSLGVFRNACVLVPLLLLNRGFPVYALKLTKFDLIFVNAFLSVDSFSWN